MKNNLLKKTAVLLLSSGFGLLAHAQTKVELNAGWKCASISDIKANGETISSPAYSLSNWQPAVVPGTVLTTLLANHKVPDPFYGMNNQRIKDIYFTGRDYYTYWFVDDFKSPQAGNDGQVYLNFRGVNYSCNIYLNGHKLNAQTHQGMFLRQSYNITSLLNKNGNNRLAVIVYPPDPVGNPNGGQGGDGRIAKNVGIQYTAGWDWIQPMRDRNTGIWDKVTIETTGSVNILNPHVVTQVPGVRKPEGQQQPAVIKASAELQNALNKSVSGTLVFTINGTKVTQKVVLQPKSTTQVNLADLMLKNPKLWWPNGYGEHYLYPAQMQFITAANQVSDQEKLNVGVREIQTSWNSWTRSRQIAVNGQKVFIKGGNWIISDAMLRFSDARYDAEVRFHRDMNLNLIRIWGGALVERPEFYNACDKDGMLVFQDFWISGDANGRWVDPLKAEDQWTRRKYPDNHQLFLQSAADQIKLVRNHPSLAMWCGGNEITPPEDILLPLRDSIMPKLDGTRWFVDFSNSDEMSLNTLGGNGDGPYGIQQLSTFWETRTFPFNSEIGSVGVGDYESLKRFIPEQNLVAPQYSVSSKKSQVDSVWDYHKYIGYDGAIETYGKPKNAEDFANKAQLVNYDQYRALMEGFSSHMWDWYTGVMIWKTQNPWTALRGQMYDYYLDPNACLYGLHSGSEPLHAMYNPVSGMVSIVNNTFSTRRDLMLVVKAVNMKGKDSLLTQVFVEAQPSSSKAYLPIKTTIDQLSKNEGTFLSLQLLDINKNIVNDNLYWLPDAEGNYSGLKRMDASQVKVQSKRISKGKVEVTLTNPGKAPVAFFNRISLVDAATHKRVLPVFYSDNYISVLPGAQKKVVLDYNPGNAAQKVLVAVSGWNMQEQFLEITE
ncbi:glycosyl hydrolase [Mucilaginibacter sp. Bleaf8]|uniref:glycoside hydrolase family 2 protein n=1 Tax=Mucilaginibacter sp. Bleaf8 TaxID=2834430 RepID=UPI001BCBD2AE|nr:glycoside hydrolase family 2 TIM barrel-domain containing protein [Mucilaginibacter sp. Bleaf8]MBS7564865.1 glycosyl hydrolase [Mucilaginibacter sp. Bleaf8]